MTTVNTNAVSGSTITQTDSVSCTASDPNCANNTASSSVFVAASADLSITNVAIPVPVIAGNNITYTQVVTNAGPSIATAATLTEITPPNTTFVSAPNPAGWSCTTPAVGAAGTITCTNPNFAAGSSTFTVILKVTAGTAAGTAINDSATVSSSVTDPNLANNTAVAADVVATAAQADLITTNVASPTSVAAGGNVTYAQSVTNNGPAAATSPSFTQTTPPNTNFQSIVAPGWSCTTPAVGAAGTITCTAATLAFNATATFTLVLQVNAGTASGTNIAETATASATDIVPNLTTNSATATVIVASAGIADMAIVKTASPSPTVASGDTITYTLTVTNNGPSTATNVIVTDPLPSDVSFISATPATCTNADGTVTCLLGTMTNGATVTPTILVLAGAPGLAVNKATVSADQTDLNPLNNFSTATVLITAATSIKLESFTAHRGKDKSGADSVALVWKTGGEFHNIGFNVYREQSGERVQLNSSLIAGSALLMTGALPKHSGKTYTWIDSSPSAGSNSYWLEDVDVNGTRILHGPVSAADSVNPQFSTDANVATSVTMSQLNQSLPAATFTSLSHRAERWPTNLRTLTQRQKQFDLAANSAVKISVQHEGWYRVTQPQLVQAGLDANVDPAFLHLYAEAIEQPIQILGATAGPGGFGPQAAIYFYGTGIDTQYSGTRVYWLTSDETNGARIPRLPFATGSNQPPSSFPFTVEITPRTTYFSALTTAHGNNFFGPLVSTTPVSETLQVSHLDQTSTGNPHTLKSDCKA